MPRLLPLCDGEATEPLVICGCAPLRQRPVQPAGQAFFDRFERNGSSDEDDDVREKAAGREGSGSDDEQSPSKERKKKEKKEREEALKLPECLKGEDLYALLEAAEGASQDDLKKAYRKICLTHHPDKHSDKTGADLEAVNLHFVKLQEAFNVLSDAKKRRKYDSMGDFDDWVPMKLKEGQDFFEVFNVVFRRNAKWSDNKPVPDLGGPDTPYEKVKAFYDFWFSFESWRDLDELIMEENGEDCFQELEAAECREERRWMERENARLRGKYQKAERQRIFGFVEVAEKHDPRVKAEKDKQNAAREAAKAAKEAKRLEAERLAKEEEDRRAAAEEEARAARALEKAQREEEKQVRKAARAKLRKMVKDLELGLAEDPLQEFLLALDPAETDALMEQLSKGGEAEAAGKRKAKAKDAKEKGNTTGAEAVFAAMKAKGVEPIVLSKCDPDEKSTEEGSASEEVSPQEAARLKKEQLEKQKRQEERKKREEEEQRKVREEQAAKRAEEKAVRDEKKKGEQEKKDRELQKANKKAAEQSKKEQEKKVKEEAKAVEQARLEKEANRKAAAELSQKQIAERQAEEEAKLLEKRTFEFERDRLARCEAFDKLDKVAWSGVVEAAQAAVENPLTASGLAAASASYEDVEELLDAQFACLGFFWVLGKRPEADALALSSGLRSRVKKLRNRLREAAGKGEFSLEAPAGAQADPQALEQMLLAANGEAVHPVEAQAAAEAPPAEESPSKAGKKKAKAKAAPGDEDLDALLEEFGMTGGGEKKSKKKGKK